MNNDICSEKFVHKHISKIVVGDIFIRNSICWKVLSVTEADSRIYDYILELVRAFDDEELSARHTLYVHKDNYILVFDDDIECDYMCNLAYNARCGRY